MSTMTKPQNIDKHVIFYTFTHFMHVKTHIFHTHTFSSLPAADRELGLAHSICPSIATSTAAARGTIRIALLLFNAHFHVLRVHHQALPE